MKSKKMIFKIRTPEQILRDFVRRAEEKDKMRRGLLIDDTEYEHAENVTLTSNGWKVSK